MWSICTLSLTSAPNKSCFILMNTLINNSYLHVIVFKLTFLEVYLNLLKVFQIVNIITKNWC